MISPIAPAPAGFSPVTPAGLPGGNAGFTSILDAAKSGVGEVNRLQAQAAAASESLALGETDDVAGTLAAVEKGELAFKTLLAVRSKLMSAFDEVRNMPV